MKNRFLSTLLFMAVAATTAIAQTAKLVETVTKKGDELVIPYTKYVLPNGLILLIHEDHSDPIVHVDVTYHVGSNRESIGRSGFAHFFEHMMFQGSDHVADEQHIKTVSEAGGTMNGTTNSDRTNYFETVPSNQLEKMLWLEADRMGFLLDAVTQTKFEVQRATVKNERGQNYDNRPYGLISEKTASALFPFGHPYSWSTIGTLADLDRVDVSDLKRFFLRWYGPNNAVLTVSGDVKPADVVKLVEKYFGPIPAGPETKPMEKQVVTLDKDRYISYEDNVRFPMLLMTYGSVHNYHADEPALDVLADILGGSESSIFYQNFIKTGIAIQANVSNPCQELAGEFQIMVLPMPGHTLAEMEKMVRDALVEFEKRGVNDEDLKKFKAKFEADAVNSLASVSGKGSMLASYQTFTGNANYGPKQLKAYMSVTKEDVMRVFNTYIKGKGAVILSVCPKGQLELKAAEDNFTPPTTPEDYKADLSQYNNLSYNKAKDTFDRNIAPAAGANPVVKVPAIYTNNLPNGVRIIGTKTDEIPSVTVQIIVKAGQIMEGLEKAGLASLTADMLNESTLKHTTEQLADELNKLGSEIYISAGPENITITISSLTKNLDATLKLAEEKMFQPRFDTADFNRLQAQQLEGIANQATQATTIANNVYSALLYGTASPFAIPVMGTEETVSKLTIDDVKAYYAKYFAPDFAQVVVVGNITQADALKKMPFLNTWAKKGNITLPTLPAAPAIEKTKIYFVNKDKAPQSEVRIGYMGLPYDATGDYYKLGITNFVLGGAFNSRINLNLREAKGWTYGARSGFRGSRYAGPFTASGGIKGAATDSAIVEFMKELTNFADKGITAEELAFTRSSMGQADALKYETPGQKAGFLSRMLEYNLKPSYVDEQNAILSKITKADIDALAKKYLPYNKMVIVVVGNKAKVYEPLQKLGYEIVELDANGKPVK